MQIDIDIVVYAVIAALILGRLWAVLGTRHDDEPQQPNPFVRPPQTASDPGDAALQSVPSRMLPAPPPAASLAGGLAQIHAIDPSFDEKAFLQNIRDIFSIIIGAYGAGDLSKVTEFLSPTIRAHFQHAIDNRVAAGQTAQSKVINIKEAEVVSAGIDEKTATLTTRIVSTQENILRDAGGTIIGGGAGQYEEATDLWVFAKDTAQLDAKWVLVETRS